MRKKLKDILYKAAVKSIHGTTDIEVSALCIDSRNAGEDDLFFARKGSAVDAHKFIPAVIERGVKAIICEDLPEVLNAHVTYVCVDSSDLTLGIAASNFYENPSENLSLIGVTGTNGKTTVASLLYQLFTKLGYACGLISTVKVMIDDKQLDATHTTPDAISLNSLLAKMTEAGCTYCFMEVSSHAIHQQRIAGLSFRGGIFTNITHDHLDYHGDFKSYLHAKKTFFDQLAGNAFALVNNDDKNGRVMLQNTSAVKRTFSLRSASDYKCKVVENLFDGLMLEIDKQEVWCRLIGEFNAYNLMAVYGAALLLEQEQSLVLELMSMLETAEGRFEYIRSPEGIIAIVDYAHTPDAIKNVLQTINSIRTGNEQLITLVGAGGDRDVAKRPLMGKIAASLSTRVILTSDNPRSEDPDTIIEQMKAGVEAIDYKKLLVITKRKEAIHTACALAQEGDIILVAGKGHEKYQEIQGVKHPFDDKEILEQILLKTA